MSPVYPKHSPHSWKMWKKDEAEWAVSKTCLPVAMGKTANHPPPEPSRIKEISLESRNVQKCHVVMSVPSHIALNEFQ